ncbi:T9SS type A sorting domain-containing protein [Neolewinella aurantiaca]|uniref:T9SS type A sorting domain-containing protein n=1 Tax=Neolewinella aurantiaca TaxID=2602767 RepID=A0A5C7FIJ4_9BACT|nr:T9SS type A sorting domain-containing protein [Neolewinella aurantiaca]TXF87137.1 T9SS type A sorting domain-containing protein [Neolewinella aurantiaca]
MTKNLYTVSLLSFFCAFLSTSLFAQNPNGDNRPCQEDAIISLAFSGATEIGTCTDDDVTDRIRFQVVPFNQAYAYVVVDATDVIRYIGFSNRINFDLLPGGALRVYAFSNYGNITASVGDTFTGATLSTPCFGMTANFVSVNNGSSGDILIASDQDSYDVCPGDGEADIITVSSEASSVTYLITTPDGELLNSNTTGSIDFDGAPFGTCYIYAFANPGPLPISPGDNISDLAAFQGCGTGLSDNFITVNRVNVDGGTITTMDQETTVRICPSDGNPDEIVFSNASTSSGELRLVITDDEGMIIGLPEVFTVDFDVAGPGICRAYNVTYTGNFTAQIGDQITDAVFSDGCYDVSDMFVEVIREIPAGGTVLTVDGESEVETCPGDGNADVVAVVNTGASGGDLVYLITDDNNALLNFSFSPSFDLEGAGNGTCRIWSLTYQGELSLAVGADVTSAELADGCFELSSDFVTAIRTTPNGGTVATEDGETEITVCPGDGLADLYTFVSTGADGANFAFIVTDEDNNIIGVPESNMVDFDGAGTGICRVWGLSYAGDLTAATGDNLSESLATECSSLSDNFVTVIRTMPTGGTVRLESGGTSATVCPADGVADVLTFVSEGGVGEEGAWIFTDENGMIIGFPASSTVDFETFPTGVCHVYSIVYSGELTAMMGDDITTTALATGCFALSDNFITVTRLDASTGTISTEDGESEIFACPGDAFPDPFRFDSTGTTLDNFNYVVTDTNNVVFFVAFTDQIDFEQLPVGTCRVYGLGYNGIIIATPGDVAGVDQLASQCNALSPNFVSVIKELPVGGTVATADGETEVSVCSQDGIADIVTAVSTGAEGENFVFIITDADNTILEILDGDSFDFDAAPYGVCRIWGLSYQGDLLAEAGADAGAGSLASACSDLSENFITVTREDIMGGSISLNGGSDAITTCPDDGIADVLNFNSIGATGSNFQYVVTDLDNVVLELVTGNSFDFEPAGPGVCRVWGFAYAGAVSLMVGDTVTSATLAEGCAELADNFITVTREVPVSGAVSLVDGSTSASVCSGDPTEPALEFVAGPSTGDYVFLIVQADSFALLGIMDTFNFNMAQAGDYHVYGLAYAGNLDVFPGQNIFTTDLATSCFDLSDNFVTVSVDRVHGGNILGNGAEELYFCPDNLDDGMVNFTTTSGEADSLYRYVIATTTNVIIAVVPAGQDSFDFGTLPLEELKVWAISYEGDFLAGPGSSLEFSPLATGCVVLSENCIRILNETPEAGEISFDDVPATGIACTVDGDGVISVSTTSTSLTGYAVLVTDTMDIVQLVSLDPQNVDLGSLPEGPYRVYGLAYTGNVTVTPGDDLDLVALADNCYELTTEFLDVLQGGEINAGFLTNITTEGTGDTINFCIADGDNPIAVIEASVSGPNYRYVVTDEDGRVRATNLPSNIIPFQPFGPGVYRIYGFNYTGMSLVGINQNINTTVLATGCGALTSNFITVIYEDPDGGMVTTDAGETEVEIEIAGSGADATAIVAFETTGAQGENFMYLITDENNELLATSSGPNIDFGPAGVGTCRVWGLSYSGDIIAGMGDDLTMVDLTDGCFDLSDNFVTVVRVDEMGFTGGEVSNQGAGPIGELMMTARPNPASGSVLYLDLESFDAIPGGQIFVRDMNGASYSVQTLVGGEHTTTVQIDISQLPSGMYFVQLASQQGMQSVRFMKD